MLNINPSPPIRGCVTAIFEDGPHTFNLTKDATLEALSARVAVLSRQHHGKLLDITVKFGATRRPSANSLRRGNIKQRPSAR